MSMHARQKARKRPLKPHPPAWHRILRSDSGWAPVHESRPHTHAPQPLAPWILHAVSEHLTDPPAHVCSRPARQQSDDTTYMTMLRSQLSPLLRTTSPGTYRSRAASFRSILTARTTHLPCAARYSSWCLCSQPARGGSRALLGLHEPAERRQGASGHGSGRQACARSRRRREAMSEIGRVHALHTVTVWCKCIDFVCVLRAVHHVSMWVELLNTTATDHKYLYYASKAPSAVCGSHGATQSYRTRDIR